MFCVFSVGSKKFSDNIFLALRNHFNTTFFDGERVLSKGRGKSVLLIASKKAVFSELPCIRVFSRDYESYCDIFSDNDISIVSSENKALLTNLSKTKARVITCGMCAKDTVTCTSIDENCTLIALQRTLCDINGRCRTPFETPVKIEKSSDIYEKMAATALLTILGVNI